MHPTPDKHGIAARHRVPPPRSGGPVGAQAKKNPAEAGFFVVRQRKRSEAELRRDAVTVRAAVVVPAEVQAARRRDAPDKSIDHLDRREAGNDVEADTTDPGGAQRVTHAILIGQPRDEVRTKQRMQDGKGETGSENIEIK